MLLHCAGYRAHSASEIALLYVMCIVPNAWLRVCGMR